MPTAQRFLTDESGLETVEYAIIAGLIVSGLVTVVVAIGTWSRQRFGTLAQTLRGG